jgi:hypothetical protein
VRADFSQGLKNLRFGDWLSSDRVFFEEEQIYSATLKAVRHAYELLGKVSQGTQKSSDNYKINSDEKKPLAYLV